MTFSGRTFVSDLIEVVGPSLCRDVALAKGRAALIEACRDVTAPVREVVDLRLEMTEADEIECKPRLREAMGASERAKGRETQLSTILTDFLSV